MKVEPSYAKPKFNTRIGDLLKTSRSRTIEGKQANKANRSKTVKAKEDGTDSSKAAEDDNRDLELLDKSNAVTSINPIGTLNPLMHEAGI